jgi:hypothetical protein
VKTRLPAHCDWSVADDLRFLKRYERLVLMAPPSALGRMAGYMLDIRRRAFGETPASDVQGEADIYDVAKGDE